MKKLIVIVGPTAVGKTEVAVKLGRYFSTAIISADSRQIYRELDKGTAKPSAEELSAVPHFFIGEKSIQEEYGAGQFGREALEKIDEIFQRKDELIVCGGSGLYIKAICEGFDDLPSVPVQVRQTLIKNFEVHGLGWLQSELQGKDPDYYQQVDRLNPRRLLRALELIEVSGMSINDLRKEKKLEHDFEIIKIGLDLPREILYDRINARVSKMMETGLLEEARQLFEYRNLNALQTVGYQELFDHLEGGFDLEEAIRLIKRNTRHYAKRQQTWFKKDAEIRWFHPDQFEAILEYLKHFN